MRTALVLGASSDIAMAIVSELRERGLERLVLAARDVDRVEAWVGRTGGPEQVSVMSWDALESDLHEPMVDTAADFLGPIDLVICAVGKLGHHAGASMGPGEVGEMVDANFTGPAAALGVVARKLVEQRATASAKTPPATIMVMSSVAAARPRRSNFVYGAAKAGLDAYARGLGDSLSDKGVRVLVIRAGFVRSRMTVGLDAAPFAKDPQTVARLAVEGLDRKTLNPIVWTPKVLRPLFAVLSRMPTSLWRRISADR